MVNSHSRRRFLQTAVAFGAGAALARVSGAAESARKPLFPFYVMDTGLVGPDVPTLEQKVALAKELGFVGIDYMLNHDQLPRMIELLDKAGLALSCIYVWSSLDDAPDAKLPETIKRLKGRPTRIELSIKSSKYKSSDPAGDAEGLALINRVADLAGDTGPVVSIYPHTGVWTERVEDGVRLAEASGRKNVGANFNLVHWKWVKQDKPLADTLKLALPHLFSVSINGLDGNKIVSLDEGNYDVAAFLQLLKKTGYRGQVGLQGYGIPGPSREHLERSMEKWKQIEPAAD